MRRSLGGLILLVAAGMFAVAVGSFWMERVAFTPDPETDSTHAILGDEEIRLQVASIIAGADAEALGVSANELRQLVNDVAQIRAGATEMRQFTADAHARVIGEREEPVEITAAEQVQIVRTERAAILPAITLPVEKVTIVSVIASITSWVWLISAGIGVVALLLGLLLRPERGEFSFAIACGLAATGVSIVLFGYLIPGYALPAAADDVWVHAIPRLAGLRRSITLIAGAIFVGAGAGVAFLTNGNRQRRQRSTPLATTRYREQQRWSS